MWGQTNKAKARKLAKYQQLDLIYRAKLRKLGQKRYGTHYLPDNAEGRAMLQARFHYEMTLEDGREYAPWADDRELRTLQHVGRRMKRNNLGPLINLTDDEREAFKMWLLSPCDVSEEELERRRINKRKESWRRSKQKARDTLRQAAQEVKLRHAETVKERPLTKDDERQAAILDMLAHAYEHPRGQGWDQHTWRTVSELTAKAKRCEAFVRVGCHPWYPTLVKDVRYAVLRALDQLEAKGLIKTWLGHGKRGPVRYARLTPNDAQDILKRSFENGAREQGINQLRKVQVFQGKIGGGVCPTSPLCGPGLDDGEARYEEAPPVHRIHLKAFDPFDVPRVPLRRRR